jgi:23S rRNA (adenine-N6)-dimethyltransferase
MSVRDTAHLVRRPELSQHFIRDPALARAVVANLGVATDVPVIEVGAGTGILTQALADRRCRVIAIEKDVVLHRALRSRLIGRTNVECHHADALTFPLPCMSYAVVSNVPFGLTAALLRRLLTAARPPEEALLIVQREAAERFIGAPRATRVSLLYAPWFEMLCLRAFSREDFTPAPSVEAVLLRIERRSVPLVAPRDAEAYRRFVHASFGATRQEARHALRRFFTERQLVRLARAHRFERRARPSEIPFGAWLAMFRFHAYGRLAGDPLASCARERLTRWSPRVFAMRCVRAESSH